MKLFGNKKINAIGLDISDTSIKVVQLKRNRTGVNLVAFAEQVLSDKVINSHMIVNEKRLADNIMRAIAIARKIDTKYVVCSIPEVKSFVRILQIPKMDESEITGAIPFELEQEIPIPVDQVYLDWQIIRQDANNIGLLVTAAPKDYIDSLMASLRIARLKPVAFELESQATVRVLVGPEYQTKNILVVDMSTAQTSFIIVQSSIVQYTSSVPIAGNAFTESISRNMGISPAEAETLKRQSGLSQADVRNAILPILDNVIVEIKNVMHFFEEHLGMGKPIDAVLLCGGSSKLAGIAEYISTRLTQNPIILGNPWVNLKSPGTMSKEDSLGYVTALGLALRGVEYDENN